ncbi:MAG: SURF1 family cytochrome oxidase biogenesis protein [Pseudomonadota bacterium]
MNRFIWGIIAIVGIILTIALGQWQGNKAKSKAQLIELYQSRAFKQAEYIDISKLNVWSKLPENEWRVKKIILKAIPKGQPVYQWIAYNGQWGRCVYGVLALDNNQAIIAKLGWRKEALSNNIPETWGTFNKRFLAQNEWEGVLSTPEKRLSLNSSLTAKIGHAIERVDIKAFEKLYNTVVLPAVLEVSSQPKGCESVSPTDSAIQKHRSYQLQWYGIAVLIALLYGYYGFFKRAKS